MIAGSFNANYTSKFEYRVLERNSCFVVVVVKGVFGRQIIKNDTPY